jgi:hypothetical protein
MMQIMGDAISMPINEMLNEEKRWKYRSEMRGNP